ncbi:hypothetical protein K501DRAFT_277495 [Backusella circina FSU 941]|nr:hypothetical protein K501DRAFT_277495 [Backusella circina FSU 941]
MIYTPLWAALLTIKTFGCTLLNLVLFANSHEFIFLDKVHGYQKTNFAYSDVDTHLKLFILHQRCMRHSLLNKPILEFIDPLLWLCIVSKIMYLLQEPGSDNEVARLFNA